MQQAESPIERRAADLARALGSVIRSRRQALAMSQDQLALATGVGRRFLIELEAGKMSCQLGRVLVVAEALGLRPVDSLTLATPPLDDADLPELAEEQPNG
jgi:transcriptional regulator with XRE-family HTH domain